MRHISSSMFSVIVTCSTEILFQLGFYDDLTVKEYKELSTSSPTKKLRFSITSRFVTDPTVDIEYYEPDGDRTRKHLNGITRDSEILKFIVEDGM